MQKYSFYEFHDMVSDPQKYLPGLTESISKETDPAMKQKLEALLTIITKKPGPANSQQAPPVTPSPLPVTSSRNADFWTRDDDPDNASSISGGKSRRRRSRRSRPSRRRIRRSSKKYKKARKSRRRVRS